MTTPRELTVLQVIADRNLTTPAQLAGQTGVGAGHAREVATYLAGRGLVYRFRLGARRVGYSITDAGRRELDGDG